MPVMASIDHPISSERTLFLSSLGSACDYRERIQTKQGPERCYSVAYAHLPTLPRHGIDHAEIHGRE